MVVPDHPSSVEIFIPDNAANDEQTIFPLKPTTTIFRDPQYSQYYPANWPSIPFHSGEVALQKAAGVHENVMSYAPRVIRPYLPQQHREFYSQLPYLVIAARDNNTGDMWATMIVADNDDATTMNSSTTSSKKQQPKAAAYAPHESPNQLHLQARPVPGDALAGSSLGKGSDVGILGIELATKRRNRVNGRITDVVVAADNDDDDNTSSFIFSVDQSFGNCPQYIAPRNLTIVPSSPVATTPKRSTQLSPEQIRLVESAQTIWVATGYRGDGEDVRYGNDASHRGGPAGFVQVVNSSTLILPEFAGNNHFNSLGNLVMDDRMGVTVPDLEHGGLLQMTGHATVDFDTQRTAAMYPGALRLTTFHITAVNHLPAGSLPIRFSAPAPERSLVVEKVVQESQDVKSFFLKPQPDKDDNKPLKKFSAGQHLPIRLHTPMGELLRSYSLSSSTNDSCYRISVKRQGKASAFLHDHVRPGETIMVQQPAGDFMLPDDYSNENKDRPIVLLSAGIGATPVLAMLQQAVCRQTKQRPVVWIQGSRDGNHHVFGKEVADLVHSVKGRVDVRTHVVYSQPRESDDPTWYDSEGHVDVHLVQRLTSNWKEADYYMCGPGAFLAEIQEGLLQAGVDLDQIHYETF